MGDLEAVGRAVESQAGDAGQSESDRPACLNCGTPLSGAYCSTCGQKARVHRSVATFFHDLFQGLFNFEGKIWRTLPMLAWRPGDMTRRYIAGERARFVSPVALYLFSVFLMFAVLNSTNAVSADPKLLVDRAMADSRAELTKLETARTAAAASGGGVAMIDRRIASTREDLGRLERVAQGQVLTVDGMDSDEVPPWVREAIAKVQRNPQAFVLKLQDAASKFSWLLIPLSVPFLWLLFPFSRRHNLYDHTVFVTYSLSFMMILVVIGGLLVELGAPSLGSLLIFIPPIHMYRQLQGAYGLKWPSALLRTVALVTFAIVAGVLFSLAILGIGLFD